MRFSQATERIIGGLAGIAMLASCSGSQDTAPLGMPLNSINSSSTDARVSHLPAEATNSDKNKRFVYVSDVTQNTVDIYQLGALHKLVGQITGFSFPQGLTVGNRRLYVANTNASTVLVYKLGTSGQLVQTLSDPGEYPIDIAVDPKTHDVAVSNIISTTSGPGGISFYKAGATTPYKTLVASSFAKVEFDAYDANGNLYFDGYDSNRAGKFGEIVGGGSGKRITNVNITGVVGPSGMQVDNKNQLVVLDDVIPALFCFNLSASYSPCGGTNVPRGGHVLDFALLQDNKSFIVPGYIYSHGVSRISEYGFPAGTPIQHVAVKNQLEGIAISPPSKP